MKCGDSINPGTLCWMQIIFWTVRFSSWNNLSCFFSLFLLVPLFFEHWEILFSHLSAPRTTLSLVYTSRKLRPSPALLHPARKNQESRRPCLAELRHRLFFSFGRVSLQAPPSRHAPSSAHPSLFFPVYYRRVPAAE